VVKYDMVSVHGVFLQHFNMAIFVRLKKEKQDLKVSNFELRSTRCFNFWILSPRKIKNRTKKEKNRERLAFDQSMTMVDTMLQIKPETEILFSISQSDPPPKAYLTLTHKGGSSCDPMAFKVSLANISLGAGDCRCREFLFVCRKCTRGYVETVCPSRPK
jgi:hypothetical protein